MNRVAGSFPGGERYRRLGPYLKERFGTRVHKVTLRGGFGCPNRDGRVGTGGCIFCSEQALLPASGPAFGPIEEQLDRGIQAIEKRTGAGLFLAYFQDQTATDAPPEVLRRLYQTALSHPRVVALAIGTRPDWLPDPVVELCAELNRHKPLIIELGLQSASDESLRRLRRRHSAEDFARAARHCKSAGLEVVAHVILDLPWEGRAELERTARFLGELNVDGVKIHNLHILRHTPLEESWRRGEIKLRLLEEYVELVVEFLQLLPPRMVVHRLTGEAPKRLMLAPEWFARKEQVFRMVAERLLLIDGWQGKDYHADNPDK
jgi:radical SAM protein (TIGR01212 family)